MTPEPFKYKPLETNFTLKGFRHTQLKREGDIAIFHKVAMEGPIHPKAFDAGFEVAVISRHDGYEIAGNHFPPAEIYPSNEQWGTRGWSFQDLMHAEIKFEDLLGRGVPVVVEPEEASKPKRQGGRGRTHVDHPPLKLPEKEFSVKDLAEFNGTTYALAFVFVKEQVKEGTLAPTRSERRAERGKATQLFDKAKKTA